MIWRAGACQSSNLGFLQAYSSDEHFSEWSDDNHGSTSDAGSEPDLGDDDSDCDDMCLSHPDAVTPAPEPPAAKTHAEARPT